MTPVPAAWTVLQGQMAIVLFDGSVGHVAVDWRSFEVAQATSWLRLPLPDRHTGHPRAPCMSWGWCMRTCHLTVDPSPSLSQPPLPRHRPRIEPAPRVDRPAPPSALVLFLFLFLFSISARVLLCVLTACNILYIYISQCLCSRHHFWTNYYCRRLNTLSPCRTNCWSKCAMQSRARSYALAKPFNQQLMCADKYRILRANGWRRCSPPCCLGVLE